MLSRDYPFELSTEASVNLADDDELLLMMRDANFFALFVGIESPDTETLTAMRKKQNTRRNLVDSIHKIYRAGMFVTAGFIIGFDLSPLPVRPRLETRPHCQPRLRIRSLRQWSPPAE